MGHTSVYGVHAHSVGGFDPVVHGTLVGGHGTFHCEGDLWRQLLLNIFHLQTPTHSNDTLDQMVRNTPDEEAPLVW